MLIRKVSSEDYNNLAALGALVWLDTYATEGLRDKLSKFVFSEFTPSAFKALHQSKSKRIYVAVHENHLIGFITIDLLSQFQETDLYGFEIETLYIHGNFQRQGGGRQLLATAFMHHGKTAWLKTWIHNTGAINFYKINHFTKVGDTEFDLLGEKHQNIVFATRVKARSTTKLAT